MKRVEICLLIQDPIRDQENASLQPYIAGFTHNSISIKDGDDVRDFLFDRIFKSGYTQEEIFEFARPVVEDALKGIDGLILIHGEGPEGVRPNDYSRGPLPSIIESIFQLADASMEYTMSMVEVDSGKIKNLDCANHVNYNEKDGEVNIINEETPIINVKSALYHLGVGLANRTESGRKTHWFCTFSIMKKFGDKETKGRIILANLSSYKENQGAEAKSLFTLGDVIDVVTTGKMSSNPHNDSEMRIIMNAMGRGSHIAILCCCSLSASMDECMSTLHFSSRVNSMESEFERREITLNKDLYVHKKSSSCKSWTALKETVHYTVQNKYKVRRPIARKTVKLVLGKRNTSLKTEVQDVKVMQIKAEEVTKKMKLEINEINKLLLMKSKEEEMYKEKKDKEKDKEKEREAEDKEKNKFLSLFMSIITGVSSGFTTSSKFEHVSAGTHISIAVFGALSFAFSSVGLIITSYGLGRLFSIKLAFWTSFSFLTVYSCLGMTSASKEAENDSSVCWAIVFSFLCVIIVVVIYANWGATFEGWVKSRVVHPSSATSQKKSDSPYNDLELNNSCAIDV